MVSGESGLRLIRIGGQPPSVSDCRRDGTGMDDEMRRETARLKRLRFLLWLICLSIVVWLFLDLEKLSLVQEAAVAVGLFIAGLSVQRGFMKFRCPNCGGRYPLGEPLQVFPLRKRCIHCGLLY